MEDPASLRKVLVSVARDAAHSLLAPEDGARPVPEHQYGFRLAQRLWAVPGALEAIAADYELLRPAAQAFAEIHALDAETLVLEVASCLPKVEGPGTALARAVGDARRAPVALCHPVNKLGPSFALVVGVAYYLQDYKRAEPIRLPRKQLGTLMGVTPRCVSYAVDMAVRHGLLIETKAEYSYEKHKAKEYRFDFTSTAYLPPGQEGAS